MAQWLFGAVLRLVRISFRLSECMLPETVKLTRVKIRWLKACRCLVGLGSLVVPSLVSMKGR